MARSARSVGRVPCFAIIGFVPEARGLKRGQVGRSIAVWPCAT
jgi:hypothetical protein